ncbi:hypothetical protein [Rathayibacter sp. VKM Ac-2857]|uniref:hypothetical protein n=1 Tax=Rathayibacter sp. VKM Ac-2857 TaxID=2739020 RepID=UPI001567189C|nr:hypothetical protein [Rathayibacter sp. VKM Ac-2857]NQX15712.1 hypothetical protein [Rathayibacter sp. VKM Ac-2857]
MDAARSETSRSGAEQAGAAVPRHLLHGSSSDEPGRVYFSAGVIGLLSETIADDGGNGDGEMTMTRHVLAATAERDGRWWLITIPELDTVGQARTVDQVDAVAREVAALFLNVPEEDVSVTVTLHATPAAESA